MKYVIGNWKSNKNTKEIEDWFKKFTELLRGQDIKLDSLEIVICPPFIYLPLSKKLRDRYQLPIKLGGQDVSPFTNGAYTGEVSARELAEFGEYVIIGHSERRTNFGEDDKMLSLKVKRAKEAGLTIIYCIQDKKTFLPEEVSMVAYEPIFAIGTGKPDTPQNANEVARIVKKKKQIKTVIYGGSVTPENVTSFFSQKYIDGVLPGGASLDPVKFFGIITNAAKL